MNNTVRVKKINPKKIALVWVNIPNYMAACIKELAALGCELLIVQINAIDDSNKTFKFNEISNVTFINYSQIQALDKTEGTINTIIDFNPSYVLLSFSNRGIYYQIADRCRKAGVPVVAASDSYFEGTFRQIIRIVLSKFGFHKNYDAIFVPGYKGSRYARLLNFKTEKIIQGLYTCDDKLFGKVGIKRHLDSNSEWPHVFIFTGQLISRKGFDTLVLAYKKYREQVANPWELWVIGHGPLQIIMEDQSGISFFKSLSAEECSQKFGMAGCFILPSIIDHWGVVVHEAACSGLPIIATYSCGSTVELVETFFNGMLIPHSNTIALANAMAYISENDKLAQTMGKNSLIMSERFSTAIWAEKATKEIPIVLLS